MLNMQKMQEIQAFFKSGAQKSSENTQFNARF